MNNASTVIPVADVPVVIKEYAGIVGKPKTLRYPTPTSTQKEGFTKQFLMTKNADNASVYNILGVRMGLAAHTKNLAQGVYVSDVNEHRILKIVASH